MSIYGKIRFDVTLKACLKSWMCSIHVEMKLEYKHSIKPPVLLGVYVLCNNITLQCCNYTIFVHPLKNIYNGIDFTCSLNCEWSSSTYELWMGMKNLRFRKLHIYKHVHDENYENMMKQYAYI